MPVSNAGMDTGDAEAKLVSLAIDHQRAHSTMSYAAAYSYIYTLPENSALREQAKKEHLARALRAVGA